MTEQTLIHSLSGYLSELFGEEDADLKRMRGRIRACSLPDISVPPVAGRLLGILIRLCAPRKVLEIGSLGGVSGIYLLRSMPKEGQLITIEKGSASAQLAREHFHQAGFGDRTLVIEGNALDVLPTLGEQGPFDAIFFDAEKSEYPDYLTRVLPLSRPGTLLLADNVLRKGKPLRPKTEDATASGLRVFNERLATDPAFEAVIIPQVGDYSYGGIDGLAAAIIL